MAVGPVLHSYCNAASREIEHEAEEEERERGSLRRWERLARRGQGRVFTSGRGGSRYGTATSLASKTETKLMKDS